MNFSKRLWRSLLFIMLISALCGGLVMPMLAPARAAPQIANALDVIINEVAWGGTVAFGVDEWIELYNPKASPMPLTGWRLTDNGNINILLAGSIPAGGYFLLERTDDTTVSDIVADQFYSGSLADGGESLFLFDNLNNPIDSANSSGGAWPAGNGTGPYSMERINVLADAPTAWATNNGAVRNGLDANSNPINGTPRQQNSATLALTATVTPTVTSTSTSTGTATSTGTPTNTGTTTATGTTTSTPTATSTITRTPTPVGFLSVVINEIAWAGTAASSSDEWIELWNPGPSPVNLSGWTLRGVDGTPTIGLTGSIPAGGFYLLERTDDTVVSDITADQFYTGDLGNFGETLHLLDSSNRLVDTANGNGGAWPGNPVASNAQGSLERRGQTQDSETAWITNVGFPTAVVWGLDAQGGRIKGTPKHPNWAVSVTPTASPIPSRTRTPIPPPTQTRAPTIAPQPLVAINEFVPRPGLDWNNDGVVNVGDEYVEIINHGVIAVSLSGYSLDDEVNIGSNPYRLPAITISPGERIVFYGSETALLLSDGGDGVRLLSPNGQLADAYNYRVVRFPDQSFCRLPDNGGLDDWNMNCFPTPGLQNALSGSFVSPPNVVDVDLLCPIADTIPLDFILAECPPFGNNIWRPAYWDDDGWYGEKYLPKSPGKWPVFAD